MYKEPIQRLPYDMLIRVTQICVSIFVSISVTSIYMQLSVKTLTLHEVCSTYWGRNLAGAESKSERSDKVELATDLGNDLQCVIYTISIRSILLLLNKV